MRIQLKKGKQKDLLYKAKELSKYTWSEFSRHLGVSESALKEWAMERNLLPLKIYRELDPSGRYNKHILEIKEKNWGQVKAGINSNGTLKCIRIPRYSKKLAELVGIILGDGNIHSFKISKKVSSYMVRIAGDKRLDRDYLIRYVSGLFRDLFGVEPKIDERKTNEMLVIVHSKRIVEFFVSMGIKSGNKIKNQVTIPDWVFKKDDYLKACIRGLIDSDGCIYTLKPFYPKYYQLCFKNFNTRLIEDTRKAFLKLGYPISNISMGIQIYLTQKKYVRKFYKEIGFSNEKHIKRYLDSPMV